MTGRRAKAYVTTAFLSLSALSPSVGMASSGGAGIRSLGAATSAPIPRASLVRPGNVTVTAYGHGITLASRASALLRTQLRFTGSASPAARGRTVEIERLGRQTRWTWAATASATVGSDGRFQAIWQTNHIGRFAIRAVIGAPPVAPPHAAAATPSLMVTVYRPAIATLYGPGFYGQHTACGEVLRPRTLGVANRTLRCGTPVAIYYKGATIVVPVIDRGPYANHADWDLTMATGRALGISSTVTLGAVSVPSR